jgi:hypothetical protein
VSGSADADPAATCSAAACADACDFGGTTFRSGFFRSTRRAVIPIASGTATALETSSSPRPVDDNASSSCPVRTAFAAPGSVIAARSVSSTWSATAVLTRTPRSAAIARAWLVTAAVSCRRCLPSSRSSSPSSFSCACRSASPRDSTCSSRSAWLRASMLSTHAAVDGFGSALIWLLRSLSSALASLARWLRVPVTSSGVSA